MSHRLAAVLVPIALALGSGPTGVSAMEIETLTSRDRQLEMAPLTSPWGKELRYSLGIGSGAFRHPSDPADEIWTVGDRGPNMTLCGSSAVARARDGDTLRRGAQWPLLSHAWLRTLDLSGGY